MAKTEITTQGRPAPMRGKGHCIIPGDRLDIVTKVVKRLQRDGISFLIEDCDYVVIREFCVNGFPIRGNGRKLKQHVDVSIMPGTRITWPDEMEVIP